MLLLPKVTTQKTEWIVDDFNDDIICESVDNDITKEKDFYIKGLYAEAEKKLINPRAYKKALLEREIDIFKSLIDAGRSWGELKHPPSAKVDEDNVSHIVKELTWDGNKVLGSSLVMNTPKGLIVKELARAGKPGVSTRGRGKIVNGWLTDSYKLITWDVVLFPSADSVVDLVFENQDMLENANVNEEQFEQFKKDLAVGKWKSERKTVNEFIIQRFNQLLNPKL